MRVAVGRGCMFGATYARSVLQTISALASSSIFTPSSKSLKSSCKPIIGFTKVQSESVTVSLGSLYVQ